MKRESGSGIRHGRRIFSSTMPLSVARASQWLQKREIALLQRRLELSSVTGHIRPQQFAAVSLSLPP
ncbi:MAG TPA: hypothetical protein VJ762_02080 [Sphingobium sp.]|nr:hypothetical protein [Sphingobium sp.]